MYWIDSHAHINDPAFDTDRPDVLARAQAAGVGHITEIGCTPEEWLPALQLCQEQPACVSAVLGVHPEYAHLFTDEARQKLPALLQDKRTVAVGEIGLDYVYLDQCPQETQLRVLHEMLKLASHVQKPIVLHIRRQEEDYTPYLQTFALLKTAWTIPSKAQYAGVLHCFSARYEEAKKALDQGLLLGINGCFTYKKNEYIREAVRKAGADKIILETDCPYLSPQGKRGQRNEPAHIPVIGQWVADYLNIPVEELAQITTQNTRNLYHLDG